VPDIKARVRAALASPTLGLALDRALPTFRARRRAYFGDGDFEAIRADLVARRAECVARLPELVAQFREEAEKVGAVVHQAGDAAEARAIVARLAAERGVRLAVKTKSMAAEEIGLNRDLESRGVTVVETDLGEWIIQLADEHPSHLLAPALHKTREQIAELFSKVVGERLPDDPETLVAVARRVLRQSFIDAQMGITGANLGIAETGTLVILTNEGNDRLVATLPPIHVAIVGIDKLVRSLDDATAVLKLLAPSATGQKASTYVSFITGPSRSADIELSLTIGVHGPKELHVVLVDNGRWRMRDEPLFREALQCIRCGACANVCPPYQEVGGHVFGHIYTGPIGLVLTAFHHGVENAEGPQKLCVSCNACETVCPAGVPIAGQILEIRQRAAEQRGLPRLKRAILGQVASPAGLDRLARFGRLAQLPLARDGFVAGVPGQAGWRDLPALAARPLRDRLDGRLAPSAELRFPDSLAIGRTVAYFAGCMTDRLYPEIGEAIVAVLRVAGAAVVFPPEQSCCGLPAVNAGDGRDAARMARQTIEALEGVAADWIVSGSASCVVTLLQDYPRLFHAEPEWRARAGRLAERLVDFTHFVDRVVRPGAGSLAAGPRPLVTLHDSCQSHNCLRLKPEARRIVGEVCRLELRELHESSFCCGFGGSFSLEFPEVSRRILARKLANVAETGAEVVVTDNPGCIMQLRGGLHAARVRTRVVHLAELMAERLGG
jgi:L-lactate dehydrogenase complex protein LldF